MDSRRSRRASAIGPAYACQCKQALTQYANRRISADLARRGFLIGMGASMLSAVLPELSFAQQPGAAAPAPMQPVTFTNFRLFDGKSGALQDGMYLVVDGNRISQLRRGAPGATVGQRVIDCGGKVMMPGLIDMHWHALLAALPIATIMQSDFSFVYLAAGAEAQRTLLRGFTTIRDVGGPAFALKQAIDSGMLSGPRIYPSGAMITTTGGHGDFRLLTDVPRTSGQISAVERTGAAAIADSADEVRLRVREQFMQGATQIKIVGCGGVSTPRSPLDMLTFTEPQLKAAVETASDWGTYVLVHAYTPESVKRAVAAGAQCIEHGHLIDERSAEIIAKNGTWLSTQPFTSEEDVAPMAPSSREKFLEVTAGTDTMYKLARKHGLKVAFGTDLLFSQALTQRQGTMLGHMTRWYPPAEVLKMATGINGQLLALAGERNPYPHKLGVLEEGAYADLLIVAGDPLEDMTLLASPDQNLLMVMKDGRIFKDTIKA
ncbi:metal-dependent hydrolase family protein [Paraburkholderia lycopersici]|uniref:Imidazolonepropionase n=1 Tax=Paraburkholderia lycopersici TaxID=416944 RepID=A0A1G6HCP7_9BURK|nr:amidohydrolase family protein [Paraburkholderia lycopersici]SDB92087.1 Imidazolonepropionase [Paraburkholderia lycopersici]